MAGAARRTCTFAKESGVWLGSCRAPGSWDRVGAGLWAPQVGSQLQSPLNTSPHRAIGAVAKRIISRGNVGGIEHPTGSFPCSQSIPK